MDPDKLLLVEDNDDVREVFLLILTAHGYDVTECANGSTAVERAKECIPDVAIIDVGLPDMNGYQVASQIRQLESLPNQKRSILVALTGREGVPSRRQSFEAGFDLHFSKPVELKTVCTEIKALQRATQGEDQSDAA